MAKVKLDFKRLPGPEKVIRGQQLVESLTNNPTFAKPNPPLADVTASLDAFQSAIKAAQIARQVARTKTVEQHQAEDTVDQVLAQLLAYIESISGGDEALIKQAGASVRTTATSSGDLKAPSALSATEGDHDGEIDLNWNRVTRARSYVIERCADPPTDSSWTHEKAVTTSSTTVSGLTRGAKYWFRVAAIGASGQSGWSDPATKIAP